LRKRWQDSLPEGAPPPRYKETRGNYALRVLREAQELSINDLARKVKEKRDERARANDPEGIRGTTEPGEATKA